MPKLIVKRKAEIIDECVLDDTKSTFTIGSDSDNDLTISGKKVSLKHFRIENINGCFYLEDLKSAFGTHLNGRPVLNRVQIVHGDEISVGDYDIVLDNISKANPQIEIADTEDIQIIDDHDVENTIGLSEYGSSNTQVEQNANTLKAENSVIQTSTDEFYQVEKISDAPHIAAIQASETERESIEISTNHSYYLVAIYGPYLGKKFALKLGDTKIGRDTKLNDIILRKNENGELDPSISRRHATISYDNGKFFVTDKRSKTRTYVNQKKLNPSDQVPISVGDEIEIVSDQKSTIFRLVAKDKIDLSSPKKAGIWWIRNNHRVSAALSIVLSIFALWTLVHSFQARSVINKKPNPLKVIEEIWYQTISQSNYDGIGNKSLAASGNLALADLTGDKKVDVILSDISGSLIALDGKSKNIIWENRDIGTQSTIPIVVADLNENGLADVLVAGNDARLRALDGSTGAEIWLSPILGESFSGPPIISDLDGDGSQDVFVATEFGQTYIGYRDIYAMNWKPIATGLPTQAAPSSSDWDGDGSSEIFLGTEEGKVLVINGGTGKIAKVFDFNEAISKATGYVHRIHSIRNPVVLADINQNKVVDLLICSTSGNYLALEGHSLTRIWYDYLPQNAKSKTEYFAPSLGDVDGDKIDDAVLVSNHLIKILKGPAHSNDRKHVLWEFDLENNDVFVTPATLADLNGDKSNDVIIGSILGTIYMLNGKNGELIAQIENDKNPPISPLFVADLGDDGYMDILLIRKDFNLYKIRTSCPMQKNSVIWGQVYGNAQHTSKLNYGGPNTFLYNLQMVASGFMLFGVVIMNLSARKKRQQLIQRNQSA